MSLQFIIGSSGAGKSYFAYERVIRESMEHPERNYYIIVPEQFTMRAKTKIIVLHMKEVIYTGIFLLLAVILAIVLFFMFGSGKRNPEY